MNINTKLEYEALIRRTRSLISDKRYLDARSALQQILNKSKNDAHALWLLVDVYWRENRHQEALQLLLRYIKLYPNDLNAQILYGDYLGRRGRFKESISTLTRLLRRSPGNPKILYCLAEAHELRGDADKALAVLEPLIKADRLDEETAWLYGNLLLQKKENARVVEMIRRQLEQPGMIPNNEKKLWFVLGKAHENLNEAEESYHAYDRANTYDGGRFDEQECVEMTERMIDVFTPEETRRFPRSTIESRLPVFVISRPRSGSTLVERIIGSHPQAHAAGELDLLPDMLYELNMRLGSTLTFPECVRDLEVSDLDELAREYLDHLERLEKGVLRVTDKTIGNYWLLGIIALMYPETRIIDLRRNPIDTCLSCWTVDLGKNFPGSCRLDHLAVEYKMHNRIMEHWHRVLENPMLRLNYEDLVADQERWSRTIIDFIGLPWDEQCLKFYETGKKQKTRMSAAPTLSYNQVTKPIYKSSVKRAEKFAPYLEPVRSILGIEEDSYPLGHDLRFD